MGGSNAKAKDAARQKARLKQMLAGGKVHLKPTHELQILGRTFTGTQLLQELESRLQPHLALEAAMAEARAKTGQARAAILGTLDADHVFLDSTSHALRTLFASLAPVLKNLGVPTGVRRKPSAVTNAAAAASRLLTRKERRTMGKRQRKAVKGGKATLTFLGPDGNPLPPGKKRGK